MGLTATGFTAGYLIADKETENNANNIENTIGVDKNKETETDMTLVMEIGGDNNLVIAKGEPIDFVILKERENWEDSATDDMFNKQLFSQLKEMSREKDEHGNKIVTIPDDENIIKFAMEAGLVKKSEVNDMVTLTIPNQIAEDIKKDPDCELPKYLTNLILLSQTRDNKGNTCIEMPAVQKSVNAAILRNFMAHKARQEMQQRGIYPSAFNKSKIQQRRKGSSKNPIALSFSNRMKQKREKVGHID